MLLLGSFSVIFTASTVIFTVLFLYLEVYGSSSLQADLRRIQGVEWLIRPISGQQTACGLCIDLSWTLLSLPPPLFIHVYSIIRGELYAYCILYCIGKPPLCVCVLSYTGSRQHKAVYAGHGLAVITPPPPHPQQPVSMRSKSLYKAHILRHYT